VPGKKSKPGRTHLLDANVLLALAWPNHPFHGKARDWFEQSKPIAWSTSALTEAAFVRLSANPAVVLSPCRPLDCFLLLEAMKLHGRHSFLSDAKLRPEQFRNVLARCHGHQQVNDAFLLALAELHHAQLVTFDKHLTAFASLSTRVLVLI
jgi:toxin-antitoxin system PIN domain toxin